jgi:dihydropteroate synthase
MPSGDFNSTKLSLLGEGIRQIGERNFQFHQEVAVMAIINRTHDSFYDRGRNYELDAALRAAERALADGADWIDIGGVPFSPISAEVSPDEESGRVIPLIELLRARTDAVISVDTFRATIAQQAISAGATAINDTSGLYDLTMADVAASTGATLIVTHSKARPRELLLRPSYDDVVTDVRDFLSSRVDLALSRGVSERHIIVDPGHDLNKNTYHSLELTRRLPEIATLGYPILASVSNKDFIGESLDLPKEELLEGTIATIVMTILGGARIIRVHDVRATVRAVKMVRSIMGWRTPANAIHNM